MKLPLPCKSTTAFSLLTAINLLFVYKYAVRVLPNAEILTLLFAAFSIAAWHLKNKISITQKQLVIITICIMSIFTLLSVYLFKRISIYSLNVDRWSVITSFWDTFFNNEYAYYARSFEGNPPGPMPFYFILSFPFYLIGELGILSLSGLFVFAAIIYKSSAWRNNKLWAVVYLATSSFYLWEISTRSNIFLNSTLALIVLVWFGELQKENSRWLLINAACAGLMLATRSIFVIPYIIVFMHALKRKEITFAKLSIFGMVAFIAFSLTFVPFVIKHPNDFLVVNPFIIQGTFLVPFHYTIFFIALAFVSVNLCKDKLDTIFYSGFVLFVSIAVYSLYHAFNRGLMDAFVNNGVDISYFIFSVPFFMFYLIKSSSPGGSDYQKG
ncbi:hypothetical protein CHISP_1023 [Chitinispirillum alkaliphilum]|nr:hypothetical protein CHISP_1023 [Chitinispirillum alkaliphilum]